MTDENSATKIVGSGRDGVARMVRGIQAGSLAWYRALVSIWRWLAKQDWCRVSVAQVQQAVLVGGPWLATWVWRRIAELALRGNAMICRWLAKRDWHRVSVAQVQQAVLGGGPWLVTWVRRRIAALAMRGRAMAVLDRAPALAVVQVPVLMAVAAIPLWMHLVLLAPGQLAVTVELATVDSHSEVRQWDDAVDHFAGRLERAFELPRPVAERFAPWILEASERQHLPPELLASVIRTESDFRTNVRSVVGAVGPAQVRPEYWSGFCGAIDLHDPKENIYCGAQILAHYAARCGDLTCALAAYNVGPRNVLRSDYAGARQRYLRKVSRSLHRLAGEDIVQL